MTAFRSARWESPRADLSGTRRALGACGAVGVTLALGAGLTGCASGAALGLVQQACRHVSVSLSLYRAALATPDAERAAQERAQAGAQLQLASPLATEAAGESPQWQALMATLAENSRLPESDLVGALQAQCAAAQNSGNSVPPVPDVTTAATPNASS
jgi:hypothetical protein